MTLERSGKGFHGDLNDNFLQIHNVPAGTADARPVFDGTEAGIPFADAFPQGAYELIDYNHDLLAARGCVQQKAAGKNGWDNARVYCAAANVEIIKIAGSPGSDALDVGAAVTVPVRFKCRGKQAACGRSCLLPEDYTCCDPTLPGYGPCYVVTGDTCGVDTTYCESLP